MWLKKTEKSKLLKYLGCTLWKAAIVLESVDNHFSGILAEQ